MAKKIVRQEACLLCLTFHTGPCPDTNSHEYILDPSWHPSDPGPRRPCEDCGVPEEVHGDLFMDDDEVIDDA